MAIAPGVYVEEGGPQPPLRFESLTAALLAGSAAKGPSNSPQAISSMSEYAAAFGGVPPLTLLDHGVRQFFDNGGREAIVLRLAGQPNAPDFHGGLTAAIEDPAIVGALSNVGIISVPGLVDTATLQLLQSFAHRERKFLVIDSGQGNNTAQVRNQAGALRHGDSLNSAIYYPWIMYGSLQLPPGPAMAGTIAKLDMARGCWKAPAGTEARVAGATGLSMDMTTDELELLNPQGICCLRRDASSILVWGARTLAQEQAAEWKYIPVRRLALALEGSLGRGLSGRSLSRTTSACGRGWSL